MTLEELPYPWADDFYAELGVTMTELERAYKNPIEYHEKLIDNYWRYRRSLVPRAQGYLHWCINRFYYMAIEEQFISVGESIRRLNDLRRHQIPEDIYADREKDVRLWMALAGAYVQGLRSKQELKEVAHEAEQIYIRIPPKWLRGLRRVERTKLTLYERFLTDLEKDWTTFVWSYQNEWHYAKISDFVYRGTLDEFVSGKSRHGHTLKKDHILAEWPAPLASFARHDDAHALFNARVAEYREARFKITGSSYTAEQEIPEWWLFGM